MIDWIIYYADGSSFTSADGRPEDAPRQGVQVIAQANPEVGRRLYWDQDTYCWQGGEWVPHVRYQCERYMDTTKFPVRLCGYWVRDSSFKAIMKEAISDPRLPVKTNKTSGEVKAGILKWVE